MPNNIKNVLAICSAALLVGCGHTGIHSGGKGNWPERNEVPVAANFATSQQLKLQAAEHWRRVAVNSAEALVKSLQAGGACIPKTGCTTLHLKRSCDTTGCNPRSCDTTFNRVFHNDFLTALVNLGYQVSDAPAANAVTVEVDVQPVAFAPNRPQYRYAGQAVQLGPGLWARTDSVSLYDAQGVAALRTEGQDANWYRTDLAAGPTPRNELVITVSAMSPAKSYIARNTRVYYTADADAGHYFCGDTARARTWNIPVVGDCSPGRCAEPPGGKR